MALFLVQHGKNVSKEIDPDKGLSDEGIREVENIAATARAHRIVVASVKHSGKKRAKQTAEIFDRALGSRGGVEEMEGLGPLDDVAALDLENLQDAMIVGHLPFMEKLVAHLVAGDAGKAPVFKFQNGGIVCLKHDKENGWYITWSLMPHID